MGSIGWDEWSYSEIMSMHGIELDACHVNDEDHDCDYTQPDEYIDVCRRCFGSGCNYCLMCSY